MGKNARPFLAVLALTFLGGWCAAGSRKGSTSLQRHLAQTVASAQYLTLSGILGERGFGRSTS
ncbi:hypothetical protein AA958_19110 [Streptomyces sp. CNQ-509]|nr:hypothetical protein AA958_19110 [Streptomyces sp. CNQ-509]